MTIGSELVYNGFRVVIIGEPQHLTGGTSVRVRVLPGQNCLWDTEFNMVIQ